MEIQYELTSGDFERYTTLVTERTQTARRSRRFTTVAGAAAFALIGTFMYLNERRMSSLISFAAVSVIGS